MHPSDHIKKSFAVCRTYCALKHAQTDIKSINRIPSFPDFLKAFQARERYAEMVHFIDIIMEDFDAAP